MAKFITMKFHGISMLVLLLITLYLCYISLQNGINIWFAAATYTDQTTSLVEKNYLVFPLLWCCYFAFMYCNPLDFEV